MYALLSIDSVLRIALAMTLLFVVVPRLAWPRTPASNGLERFWWDFGVGLTLLTIAGQLLTLMKLYALPTLLLLCAAIVLFGRAAYFHRRPLELLAAAQKWIVMATINVLERRVNVRRRVARAWRRVAARGSHVVKQNAPWIALIAVAAAFRLYRPFASANLGFSDSYVHLYLLELLEQGSQVDPAWGPYPRGMHFLLLAIQRLTNIDEILLINFFGAFVGILTTLAVAYTARRLARSTAAGLLAGFVFATMAGGVRQYFVLGGSFETLDRTWARLATHMPYANVPPGAGEFDVLLTAFQRQSSTLSQELAIALLFPAAIFLLDAFQGAGGRAQGADGVLATSPPAPRPLRPAPSHWHWAGFIGCTAAIAATHSGVLVPLVILCAIIAAASLAPPKEIARGAAAGLAAILLGSTWMLAFFAYPLVGSNTRPGGTALFYFPFLRHFADAAGGTSQQQIEAYNSLTPFLIALAIVAVFVILSRGAENVIAGATFLVFLLIHLSWRLGLPQVVESRRNTEWLLMSAAILIGSIVALASRQPYRRRLAAATVALAWLLTIPNPATLNLLNYSGYGTASLAVVKIAHQYEPFTWTLVSYGQEFPMVLGRGFHLPAADFLERYDPAAPQLRIPTRHVFVMVERRPHRFEVRDWRVRFGRAEVEQRLLTWCQLYRATHDNVRLFLDDGNVAVYQIDRSQAEANRIATEARAQ